MLLRLAFQFLRCIKKCSGKFAQTTARNRISSRSKNIFALALKTFGKNPSGGGVGNEGERLRVWDYPNKQNAGAFYGKGTLFLCLLRKKQAANGYSFAVLTHYSKSRKGRERNGKEKGNKGQRFSAQTGRSAQRNSLLQNRRYDLRSRNLLRRLRTALRQDEAAHKIGNRQNAYDNGFPNPTFFIDDGVSGVTFDRPGWNEMIRLAECGKVKTVIVKDMSRMGRDYLKVGYYTESFFAERDIRYIAINDGVDSDKGDNDFTPFRNLFNDFYARDTSKKIRAVMKAKGNAGEHLCSNPPYVYIKDPADKKKWIVDPEAAEVVERIFDLCIAGKGPMQIAKLLTADKVLTVKMYGELQDLFQVPQAEKASAKRARKLSDFSRHATRNR